MTASHEPFHASVLPIQRLMMTALDRRLAQAAPPASQANPHTGEIPRRCGRTLPAGLADASRSSMASMATGDQEEI
jgi:hypothetical protein